MDLGKLAVDLQYILMLVRISGGDLIAIEGKYHCKCLSDYKNQHRSHVRDYDSSLSKNNDRHLIARAITELVY